MDTNKPIIICGSGNSVPFIDEQYRETSCGLPVKLKHIIENNYCIGLNYWFQFGCETTFNLSGDWQFYDDNREALKKLPMILASEDTSLKNKNESRIHDNTILLPNAKGKYHGTNAWEKGFYTKQLIGIYGLNLAIALGFKEIYLLGYDCIEIEGKTHFYQGVADLSKVTPLFLNGKKKCDREHFRGIGKTPKGTYKTSTYNNVKHLNKFYNSFEVECKKIKIYNVSISSVINTFPKISYGAFFQQIEDNQIDQVKAREEIKEFILSKLNEK